MRIERIGRYEVIETLARGGMGVVYKARDPLIDRVVAVKTLGIGLSPIEAQVFRKRFAREAKSAGRLNHPNIVTIHDMGESEDGAYIAMEFLEGRSLRDVLDTGVVLLPAQVARIATQVADGLAFAHQHGVVHCDIKPGNVMLLENGAVKITDFGIAMLPTGSRTFAGNVLGSPRYISPEQIVGRPIDARSDIFSLGAVLYEMLTGVPPFAGEAIDEILYQVINEKPQAPSVRNRSIPAVFDAIVERALAKDPGDRYQHVDELAAALRPLASALRPTDAPLPPIAVEAPAKLPLGHDTVDMQSPPQIPSAVELVAVAEKARSRATLRRRGRFALIAMPVLLLGLGVWAVLALPDKDGSRATGITSARIEPQSPPNNAFLEAVVAEPASPVGQTRAAPNETAAADRLASPGSPAAGAVLSSLPSPSAATPTDGPLIGAVAGKQPPGRATSGENTPSGAVAAAPIASDANGAPPAAANTGKKALAAEGSSRLGFAVSPWGEIYVDGRKRGVSPPLNELKLAPGTYQVEIRNAGFAPHVQTVELRPDATHRIKYKFQ